MILLVLFIVFMSLALVSAIPGTRIQGFGVFIWLSVLMLFGITHGFRI